jgi:molecular chaperone GrpE
MTEVEPLETGDVDAEPAVAEADNARTEAEVSEDATVAAVRAMLREELDQVVPHVVSALKRNDGVAELARRLDAADRKLAQRDQRPVIARLHRLLGLVRRTELPDDVHEMLVRELVEMLEGLGYTEFGDVGEPFDPARHEPLDGAAGDGVATVVEIYEPGLEALGEVVVLARVRVGTDQQAPTEGLQ